MKLHACSAVPSGIMTCTGAGMHKLWVQVQQAFVPAACRLVWHEEPSGRSSCSNAPCSATATLHAFTGQGLQVAMLGAAFTARLPRLADGKVLFPDLILVLQDSTYKYFEIVMVDPHHKCVRKVGAIAGLHLFWQGKDCSSVLDFASQTSCKLLLQCQRPKLPQSCCIILTAAGPAHQLDCKSCAQAP